MNFDLIRPCGNCPFRNDRPPFGLRRARIREILGGGKGRAWWPTPSFPCHKTLNYGARVVISPSAQQCAGVMIILHREDRWNDAMQLGQRLRLWHPGGLDMSAPVYASTQAAMEAT